MPSGLSATLSGGWVGLSWDIPSPADATITKYQYRIKAVDTESDYGLWTDVPSSGASTAGYRFPFTGSGRHNVQLRAVNATGSGDHAIASTGVPEPPAGLRASLSGGSLSLRWTDPGDDSIRSYDYRIKTAGSGNAYGAWTRIANSGASTVSATITVSGSDRRIVQLRANGSGTSESATASDKPPARLDPAQFSAGGSVASGSYNELNAAASSPKGAIVVTWSDPSDDSILKYQYKFRAQSVTSGYSQPIDIPLEDLVEGVAADGTTKTVSYTFAFSVPEMHRVTLWAANSAGLGPARTFNMRPAWPALAAPSGLRAMLSGGSVSLSWNKSSDRSIHKYQYRIKTVGADNAYGSWTDIAVGYEDTAYPTSFYTGATITVTGSERRIVQLRALRRSLGAPSSPATASTGLPAAPNPAQFSAGGSVASGSYNELNAAASSPKGAIVVTWSDPGDESILKYQYMFRAQSRPGSYSQWIDIPGSGASTTSHTFVFPTPEMYRVRLRTVNSAGPGPARTFNMRPAWPALAVPSGLKASLSGGSVSLSWNNPFDGSIHKYQYRIKTVSAGNAYSSWTDIAGSNSDTTSATIAVTGSERRIVQLRALRRSLDTPSSPATASTGPPARLSGFTTPGGSSSVSGSDIVLTAATSSPKGSMVVSWSDPGDDSITKYEYNFVYRFEAPGLPLHLSQPIDIPLEDLVEGVAADGTTKTVSYTFVFPTPETHYVGLWAVNSAGQGSVLTANGKVQTVHMKPSWPALAVPSGLKASLNGSSLSLSWDHPLDGSIHKYQYRIKTVGAGSSWSPDWTDVPGSKAYTTSATITVTGSGHRIVQLRAVRRSLGAPSGPAEASTE